ncbi:MAG: hypothetical protein WCP21_12985, partial [Armatimonadota bacterium]
MRRVANEMVQALKQEPLAKVLVASPLMEGLASLANLGYDGRLLDLVGRCQCLAQMLPPVAIPDIPLGAVPAASIAAPRPPSLGAWELYARPGDVEDWETVLILSGCTW